MPARRRQRRFRPGNGVGCGALADLDHFACEDEHAVVRMGCKVLLSLHLAVVLALAKAISRELEASVYAIFEMDRSEMAQDAGEGGAIGQVD